MRAALLATMLASGLAADDAKLPDAAKASQLRYESAVAEARRSFEATQAKAAKALAEELTRLQGEATKAGRLDEAIALRDAAKVAGAGEPASPRSMVLEGGGKSLTISDKGYRWNDWAAGLYGPCRLSPAGGYVCYSADKAKAGKPSGYLFVAADRGEALWWVPGEPVAGMKLKK